MDKNFSVFKKYCDRWVNNWGVSTQVINHTKNDKKKTGGFKMIL